MNVADSARLAGVLESAGYQDIRESGFGDSDIRGLGKCDIILVNTCVVRQHAEDRAAGFVRSLSGFKKTNPNLKIALCGCFVNLPGRDLRKQFPHVDLFIGPNEPEKLAEFLNLPPLSPSLIKKGRYRAKRGGGEFVTIMHGCDNFCSYCIVPYVRGREYSRPMDEILEEIKNLAESGVRKITLLGQNVNSYKYGLANLLRQIPNYLTTHFLTSHPRDMSDEIIETVAELPYVAKEFVMPLQSGDDEILRKMNRGYTLHYYVNRVNKIRSLMPEARITTDLLVGFPGETEEQFQNTLQAVKMIRFDEVHMFAYSDRPGTAAAKMPGRLPENIKRQRLQKLIEVVRRYLV